MQPLSWAKNLVAAGLAIQLVHPPAWTTVHAGALACGAQPRAAVLLYVFIVLLSPYLADSEAAAVSGWQDPTAA